MEMAFTKKGGMKDDGMDRDPVSGNDIPVGSTAKEVRDDIPAMLSEGEYVVPADVVQYYGVKMFEDLRIQAKLGLQDMENNGRIGGEPVDEDLRDDEQAVLMEIMQMNTGGVVGNNSLQNPTGPEGLEGNALRQYLLSPTQSSYITPGALQIEAATTPRFSAAQPPDETVPVCPAGQVFDKEKNMCVPIETTPVNRSNDDPNHPLYNQETTPFYENINWSDPTAAAEDLFGLSSKIGAGLGTLIGNAIMPGLGGLLGGYGVKLTKISEGYAQAAVRKAMGDVKGAETILAAIDNQFKNVRGLQGAYNTADKIIGADGDMNKIKMLQHAGISVDSTLRDKELTEFFDKLSEANKRKLIKTYGTEDLKKNLSLTKAAVKPTKKINIGGEDVNVKGPIDITKKDKDGGPSLAEKIQREYKSSQVDTSAATKGVADTSGERKDASGKKAGDAGYVSKLRKKQQIAKGQYKGKGYVGGSGFNKGGLMTKKK